MNFVTDIFVINNSLLILEHGKQSTKICRSTINKIFLAKKKIRLWLNLKNSLKKPLFNILIVYNLFKSACNLVSLRLLYCSSIYYNNINKILNKIDKRQILV